MHRPRRGRRRRTRTCTPSSTSPSPGVRIPDGLSWSTGAIRDGAVVVGAELADEHGPPVAIRPVGGLLEIAGHPAVVVRDPHGTSTHFSAPGSHHAP